MEIQKAPLRVLLTDDDAGDRLVFNDIFEELEIDTIVNMVNDGEQLMDFLKNENQSPPTLFFWISTCRT